ncbi:MAG: hypothetical protein PHS48_03480 [Bacteroidales bacterium]|nr:hypothetical protein [Bacteroidales bacterium]
MQRGLQKIDDHSFTAQIVESHLAKKRMAHHTRPFYNFMPIIVGLSLVLISLGFILLIKHNDPWMMEANFTLKHGLISFVLSFIFLIHNCIDDFSLLKTGYK